MNSTSPSSSLVRIAARSPARSSAGPDVMCRCTPISAATMPASVVLPSPGGPANSRWSTGWPRLRGRLEHDRQVLLQLALADELGEAPRPQPGLDDLLGVGGRRRGRGTRHARRAPSSFERVAQQRRRHRRSAAARAARRGSRRRRSRGRPAPRGRRRSRGAAVDRRRRRGSSTGTLSAVAQLDEQPLGGLLADAGHERERRRRRCSATMSTSAAGGWVARIAIASAGPTPWVAISIWNVDALVAVQEAVQRLGVLADVVVDVQERRRRRLELGQRPRRDA